MPVSLLELQRVSKSYLSGDVQVPVLKEADFQILTGTATAIVGPSGSGKSTLLNLLGTLDKPDSGSVLLSGQDVTRLDERALAAVRNREIGFVFQAHHLLPHCTVLENVLMPALAGGGHAASTTVDRAKTLLKRVGIDHRLEHLPGRLSGGERQRVAVVRALINSPKILLADEPTGALDRTSANEIGTLLLDLNREQQVTLVVVTHSQELASRFERVVEVNNGRLTEQLRKSPTRP
ncbi:MAG TPA: ABC transporter ATP-binding protein [Candidatus Limnocylindria bacterium]|jgi:ABC-type lipoprotein export system ATPase subunit|nr:ABC transporter ATP-binding protein [Candidatus Limnocylindria bacterium]